ncbi:MFS transporter [Limosilactobacillus fermentum]|nr:MFS transporter [Limosilactobacillus fermentum]
MIGTLLTGTLPIYISNFTLILLSRVLFGFFTGLFGALAISILSDYYTGSKRASMIGYVNAMGSIGAGLVFNHRWLAQRLFDLPLANCRHRLVWAVRTQRAAASHPSNDRGWGSNPG